MADQCVIHVIHTACWQHTCSTVIGQPNCQYCIGHPDSRFIYQNDADNCCMLVNLYVWYCIACLSESPLITVGQTVMVKSQLSLKVRFCSVNLPVSYNIINIYRSSSNLVYRIYFLAFNRFSFAVSDVPGIYKLHINSYCTINMKSSNVSQ